MLKPSKRSINLPQAATRKLSKFADAAKKAGKKVYHLNIGQPDVDSPEQVLQALNKYDQKYIPYTASQGNLSYREKLLKYYRKHNIDITADEILVTASGSEALFFALSVACDLDDEIIVPEPFYTNYSTIAGIAGVNIVPVTAKFEESFALPPIESFSEKITDRTKAILICNPSNPTGYVYSEKELLELKELCIKHDLFLISDEVYREFNYSETEIISALNISGMEDRTIVVDSVSKRYNTCGLRIGAFITRNQEVITSTLKYAQARLSPPTLGQFVAEEAIETPDSYFDEVTEKFIGRRDLLVERINNIPGAKCNTPEGAFYLLAKLPVDNAENFCKWLLTDFDDNQETIMFAPAEGFYKTPGLGINEVRIAYVLNRKDLNRAMDILEKALAAYPGKE